MARQFTGRLRLLFAAVALLATCIAPARAADLSDPLMLVATPELYDPLYGRTVLVVRPMGNGQFLGFIINRPTKVTLAQAFPNDIPSQKVADPIFLGGPAQRRALFALVQSTLSPGAGSIQFAPDLFVAMTADTVDRVIEHEPEHARFVMGAVIWRPGELESEIKRGVWYVDRLETDLTMRKETGKLWEELVQRLQVHRQSI